MSAISAFSVVTPGKGTKPPSSFSPLSLSSAGAPVPEESPSVECFRSRISATIDHLHTLLIHSRFSEMERVSKTALDDPSLTPLERSGLLVEHATALIRMHWYEIAEQQIGFGESLRVSKHAAQFVTLREQLRPFEAGNVVRHSPLPVETPQMRISVSLLIDALEGKITPSISTDTFSTMKGALEDPSLSNHERAHLTYIYARGLMERSMYPSALEEVERALKLNIPALESRLRGLHEMLIKMVKNPHKRPRLEGEKV